MHPYENIKRNFGFGMMRLPMDGEVVDTAQVCDMVDSFLERGFNYFDTAHPYINGLSETAVRDCLAKRHNRDEFLLTNKLSPNCWETPDQIMPFIDLQLKQCGVEYFDFYLMHALNYERHQRYDKAGAYEIVKEQMALGKIRHLGISFHDCAENLDKILTERPEIEVVQLQLNYADWDDPNVQSRLCYEVCVKHGKPVIVMEPVKGGSLANLPEEANQFMPNGSHASYALRFAASHENVFMVLSGMSNREQVEDNITTMADFKPLTSAEQEALQQVKTIYQSRNRIPCTGCRYCEEQCPAGIPISTIFALSNRLHRKPKEGAPAEQDPKEAYAELSIQGDACVGCGLCIQACPQHLIVCELVAKSHEQLK